MTAVANGGAGASRAWYVLHVRPRSEKKVMEYLSLGRGFRYLPFYTKTTKTRGRKVKRTLPLFPGYVFAHLSPEERLSILKTNLVLRTINVFDPRTMIHQLRQVARVARHADNLRIVNMFKAGDYVRVKYGPFSGTEGFVKRKGANATLCLNVEILGTAVEVSVPPGDVETAKPPQHSQG